MKADRMKADRFFKPSEAIDVVEGNVGVADEIDSFSS